MVAVCMEGEEGGMFLGGGGGGVSLFVGREGVECPWGGGVHVGRHFLLSSTR